MAEHRVIAGGSTENADLDTLRQRFHCPACDLTGNFTISPASSGADLLAALDDAHRRRGAAL